MSSESTQNLKSWQDIVVLQGTEVEKLDRGVIEIVNEKFGFK